MTITYNDKTYIVTDESVFSDFYIVVASLDEACTIVAEFEGMSDYTFGKNAYTNMIVSKRSIVITDTIMVNVKLRQKKKVEVMQEEIDSLRAEMSKLAETTNKTTTAKINKILEKTSKKLEGVIE